MHVDRKSVAVVGAGIVGTSIASRLVRSGSSVVLIDRGEPGRQASYGNAGHIATEQVTPLASPDTLRNAAAYLLRANSPLSIRGRYLLRALPWLMRFAYASRPAAFARGTEALASLNRLALDSLRRVLREASLESELHARGHLVLTESEEAARALRNDASFLAEHGVPGTWRSAAEVRQMVPGIAPSVTGAQHFSGSAHVSDPLRLCRGLTESFAAAGGELRRDEVRGIAAEPGGFALSCESGTMHCEKVVIAAGAWSRPLARQLGDRIPLDTERGYHLQAPGYRAAFDLPVASFDRWTIMTPLAGGLRITGFVELGGLELPPNQRLLEKLQAHLQALLPGERFPPFERWMGFRPSLPDHLPVIGPSRRHPGATYAFGHQHLGLTLAGVTAEMVEALLHGQTPPVDLHPFRCDRFQTAFRREMRRELTDE